MVKRINMKGGGNEVIMIIAVLFICLLIGGAAFVLTQDDLKACPNGTTAVTDKCKCSDGHECETGKYCYDDICNASAETTSPQPVAATSTNCSDGVSTDEATCIANTDCPVFPATDPATTTSAACVWTPPVDAGGGPPPPPSASAAPCFNAGTCDNIGGSYVCKQNSRSGTGYYQKENGSSQDADFCSLCPTFSVIGPPGVGIESCVCTGGKYLQNGVCLQCGAHTVYDGSSCVCNLGENYITDGTSGDCIPNTADPGNNPLTEADFTNLHPSQYNILVGDGYPTCKVGPNGCQANQVNIDILNNLVVRDSDTSGWKNREDQSIITAGMDLICPDGESLTRTGNIVSCESNQCMVSSRGFAGSAVDLNNFPGVGCIETTTLNNLFSLNADNTDNTDIYIYDASGVQQSVKDTLVGLCSDGKTCETSPTTSPDACDVLSDKVVADHSAQHGLTLFDAPGGTCQCPESRRSSRTPADTASPLDVCNPSCADQVCQTQATITNASGVPITYDIANPVPKDLSCMCPECINGFTNDPVTGECTVDSGTGRDDDDNPSTYDNGRGFCQNETKININWHENDYTSSQIKSELKNSDGEYLSRSYKSGSGHWIHECVPQAAGDDAKLSNKYNPFTRYKCEINQFLNSSGECQILSGSCAENLGTTIPDKFIGKYRKYSPECSIHGAIPTSQAQSGSGGSGGSGGTNCPSIHPTCDLDGSRSFSNNTPGWCYNDSTGAVDQTSTAVGARFGPYCTGDYDPQSPTPSPPPPSGGLVPTDPDTDACCESCGPHTADGPWFHPEIFTIHPSGFYNAVEINASDANNSGVGYNTRHMLHNVETPSEDLTLSPATAEEIKKNLFVCQKTNFTGGSGELWGSSDIGAPTTTGSSQTIGLDPECQTPNNNPNTYDCQRKFKYFDSATRTAGTSERYLWMKSGDEYNYPEGMPDGCPAIARIGVSDITRSEGLNPNASTAHYDGTTANTMWNQLVTDWGTKGWQVQSTFNGGDCPTLGHACFQPTNGTNDPASCGTDKDTPYCFAAEQFATGANPTHQSIQTWKRVADGTTDTNNHSVKCHAQMAYLPSYGSTYDDQIRAKYSYYNSP